MTLYFNFPLYLGKIQNMSTCQSSVVPEMDGQRKKETHSLFSVEMFLAKGPSVTQLTFQKRVKNISTHLHHILSVSYVT